MKCCPIVNASWNGGGYLALLSFFFGLRRRWCWPVATSASSSGSSPWRPPGSVEATSTAQLRSSTPRVSSGVRLHWDTRWVWCWVDILFVLLFAFSLCSNWKWQKHALNLWGGKSVRKANRVTNAVKKWQKWSNKNVSFNQKMESKSVQVGCNRTWNVMV